MSPGKRIARLAVAAALAAGLCGCTGSTLVHDARRSPAAGAPPPAVPTAWAPPPREAPPSPRYDGPPHYEVVRPGPAGPPWRAASITVPIWVPGVTGSFARGSTSVDADRPELADDIETATNLEFALVGRLDLRFGRTVVFTDVFGVRIGETATYDVNGADASGSIEGIIGRVLVGRRVVQACPDPCRTTFDLDVLGGARIYHASIDLDEPAVLSFSAAKTWVDPIVGVRAVVDPPGPWDFSLLADVGGFGVGSEISWSVSLEARWHFARHWSLMVGWAWLGVEYDVGSSTDRFLLDIDVGGPQLGVTYEF